jgi:TolB-like protein/Tfp pilus assembly protein PilF
VSPITKTKSLAPESKPAIAVLPFVNMSDDASQEYFADGIVEDIITGLSRIKWFLVIARNSSFVYKTKVVDVRQAGRELGVRYILEGSVRKVGSRLRVTAQLVEAETGSHLWADRYDGALEAVFDFQDSITERVVGIIEPSVRKSEIERSRRKRPDSLDAYDLFLRSIPHLQARMPDEGRVAIPLLEKALQLDPDYHAARAHLAWCYEWCFTRGGLKEADRADALRHARYTLASDTDDAAALAVAGWVIIVLTKERPMATEAIERALSINPSCATAHYFAALVNSFAGETSAATFHAQYALRLSPFDPSAFEAHLALGIAAVGERQFDEAAEHFATASRANPRHSLFPFCHAIALALAGRLKEAEGPVQRGLELEPGFRIRIFSEFGMSPLISDKFIEGARVLGLPE